MKNSIKALAKEAKQRMRLSGAPEDRSTIADVAREEERVYRIVCRLEEEQGVVTNPIMQVADQALWKTLKGVERERYVLNLAEVYHKEVARYRAQKQ